MKVCMCFEDYRYISKLQLNKHACSKIKVKGEKITFITYQRGSRHKMPHIC
jgi:hypothetical protein